LAATKTVKNILSSKNKLACTTNVFGFQQRKGCLLPPKQNMAAATNFWPQKKETNLATAKKKVNTKYIYFY
jgi:hypothetical protein